MHPASTARALAGRVRRFVGTTASVAVPAVLSATLGRLRVRWRRSLQLRVVTTTMAVSVAVVAVLGFFLMQQIAEGLLAAKQNAALTEQYAGLTTAQNEFAGNGNLERLATTLARRSGAASLYEVVIAPPPSDASPNPGWASNDISASSIPERLRAKVAASGGDKQQYTYTTLRYNDTPRSVPGLVVGAPIGGQYQLYYLFPLDQEQATLDLVRRTLIVVGAALVLLLAVIAWLVTRQVVMPVRSAAGAAERVAAGALDERMPVRGEDDLAKLASSFNDMAGNLADKIRELEELSQVQRQFVSDVSHELRTPLTTIRIAADLLYEQREAFDEATTRSSELLQNQLERFEALLVDLLEISRYDAGAATLDAEPADLRDLVMRAVGDTEHLAEVNGTKVVLRLPAQPCGADVDTRRVERILRNLLVNAVEHGEGRDVVVTVTADNYAVAVAVRDHGVGLKPGEEVLVFDRFWRADPARARKSGGTGLGLAISREDALLHGGWLQAWGRPGDGSVFRLTLPRQAGGELRGSPLPLVPPEGELVRGRPGLPRADEPAQPRQSGADDTERRVPTDG